jgi:SAM-dependent methyltransferase
MDFQCYFCQHKDGEVLADWETIRFKAYRFKDKKFIQCNDCGLTQFQPQWTESELEILYKHYFDKSDFVGQIKKEKFYYPELDQYIDKTSKVLELGCSRGDNLERLDQKYEGKLDIRGCDWDESAIKGSQRNLVFNCDAGFMLKSFQKYFDLIYGINFLEHHNDPLSLISTMIKALKIGGMFYFEVPNLDDPLLKLYHNESFRRWYFYPYHSFIFTPRTLANLFLEFSGRLDFKIELKQRYGLLNHWRWAIRGEPSNKTPEVPILEPAYRKLLTLAGYSDTLIVRGIRKK